MFLLLAESHNEGGAEDNIPADMYVNGPPVFMTDAEGTSNYEELEDTANDRKRSHTYDDIIKEERQ